MCCTLVVSALANAIDPFVKPANRWSKRNPVVASLPLLLQLLESFPDRIVVDLLHANVVQLQQIDVIGLESRKGGIRRPNKRLR